MWHDVGWTYPFAWSLLLLTIAVMFVVIRRETQRTAAMKQSLLCSVCGYDVRATPDQCPECGCDPSALAGVEAVEFPLDPVALQNDWPAAPIRPRIPDPGDEMVVVHSGPAEQPAIWLVEQLRARGVAARHTAGNPVVTATPYSATPYAAQSTFWRVMVWYEDAERARLIVDRFRLHQENET